MAIITNDELIQLNSLVSESPGLSQPVSLGQKLLDLEASIAGAGGIPHTLAAGANTILDDGTTAILSADGTTGALASGKILGGGTMSAAGVGSRAHGSVDGAGGVISAAGVGALATGQVFDAAINTYIRATADGSLAGGIASYRGQTGALGQGSIAWGRAHGVNGRVQAQNSGSMATGFGYYGGQVLATFPGARAHGYAYGAGSKVQATRYGSVAMGASKGANSLLRSTADGAVAMGLATNGAKLQATGVGAMATGYTKVSNDYLEATGKGARAHGYVKSGDMNADGVGSVVSGYVRNAGRISATDRGSHVFGATSGVMYSYGWGGLTFGYCGLQGFIGSNSNGHGSLCGGYVGYGGMYAQGTGSISLGYVDWAYGHMKSEKRGSSIMGVSFGGSLMQAKGVGSMIRGIGSYSNIISGNDTFPNKAWGTFAGGYSQTGYGITADGAGAHCAFAWGLADTAAIVASAKNATQFGPGTNAQADSLSVGTGPRLKGTDGAPSTPRNGDIWVASGYIYMHSNSTTQKITGV